MSGLRQHTARQEREGEHIHRSWLLLNTPQWTRSDETASKPEFWTVFATPESNRRSVGREFASVVSPLDGVSGIWITETKTDLAIAIALDDLDLEPQVRETFIDLVCEKLDPSEGELFVFPSEQVPHWAQRGESLI